MHVLVVLFLLISNVSANEFHLARAIQGEGPHLAAASPNSGLAEMVGHVVLNRLDAGWCDSIRDCVDGGFWGARNVVIPESWAVEAARVVLEREESTRAFYVFSLTDCNNLALNLEEAIHMEQNGRWGLVFFGRDLEWRKEASNGSK